MSELSKSIMDLLRKMPELFSLYGYSQVGSMSTPKLTLMPVSSSPLVSPPAPQNKSTAVILFVPLVRSCGLNP
jgi:hypothetical protein